MVVHTVLASIGGFNQTHYFLIVVSFDLRAKSGSLQHACLIRFRGLHQVVHTGTGIVCFVIEATHR
jgi:hypothetical protein